MDDYFDLAATMARINAQWLAAHPEVARARDAAKLAELVQDRAAEMITWHDHLATAHRDRLLEIANELYEASSKLIPGWPTECVIPAFLLRPTSGACSHCGQDCDEPDEQNSDEWIHESCAAELVAETERDQRLDSPQHGQARYINRER